MLDLDGAGGAPRLHAFCSELPATIQDYAGIQYSLFYTSKSPIGIFLKSLIGLSESLLQVHDKGFVHNDIKSDNITVQGPPTCPVIHIIDFGLATRIGDTFYYDFFGMPRHQLQHQTFRSPEVKKGLPLQASSDVFSVGMLMARVSFRR